MVIEVAPLVVDFAARFYWLIQRLVNEVEDQDIAEIYEYFQPRKLTLCPITSTARNPSEIDERCHLVWFMIMEKWPTKLRRRMKWVLMPIGYFTKLSFQVRLLIMPLFF